MKRNLDTVRDILLLAESATEPITDEELEEKGIDIDQAAFHAELMSERGLIVAGVEYEGINHIPMSVTIERVTWEGYDYLDAIRSDTVWRKAKKVISKTIGEASLVVVKEACKMIAINAIKEQIGQ